MVMSAKDWELYLDENVLVANFSEGMPSDGDEYAKVNARFEELAKQDGATAHLSLLNMSSSLNKDVFEKAREAAEVGSEYGITKWAIVSDGIKSMALSSQVRDVPGVDVLTANNVEEALEWAKQ